MNTPAALLYLVFFIALLFLAGLRAARTLRIRRIVRWTGTILAVLFTLAILTPAYLVTRLDGSIPPTLLQFLADYWLPLLLITCAVAGLHIIRPFRLAPGAR